MSFFSFYGGSLHSTMDRSGTGLVRKNEPDLWFWSRIWTNADRTFNRSTGDINDSPPLQCSESCDAPHGIKIGSFRLVKKKSVRTMNHKRGFFGIVNSATISCYSSLQRIVPIKDKKSSVARP